MSRGGFGVRSLILWAMLLSLTMLPLIGTLNDLMAKAASAVGLDTLIERYIAPPMAAMVATILRYVFGMEATALGQSIYLMEGSLPYRLLLDWNCAGWQSLLLLIVSLAAALQGDHSMLSRLKCILLGFISVALFNLFRIALDALLLEVYGPSTAIAFHDHATLPLTFLWLAAFWYVSTNYILTPRTSERGILNLRAAVDFLLGRRTLSVTSMAIILLSTFLGGLGILSTRVSAGDDPTKLSFEWFPNAVEVCNTITNRVMTHPDYTELNDTAYADAYTASETGWVRVWEFYLYGPLEEDYTMQGTLTYVIWLKSSVLSESSRIVFTIYDIDENGDETEIRSDTIPIMLTKMPELIMLIRTQSSPYTFDEEHTIELAIDLYVRAGRTYTLYYDSPTYWSYLQLPGIVVPENALALLPLAPLIPGLMRRRGEGDEED